MHFLSLFGSIFKKTVTYGDWVWKIEVSLDPICGFFDGLNRVFKCYMLPRPEVGEVAGAITVFFFIRVISHNLTRSIDKQEISECVI